MEEQLNLLYEDGRQLLISSSQLEEIISKLQNKKVRLTISEMLKTIQADLLILLEFLGDLCGSPECDWDRIVEEYSERVR